MGMFDVYGETQLKVGEPKLRDFKIGDEVPIPDGVYLGWEGVVVVLGRKFVAEFPTIVNTYGDAMPIQQFLRRPDPMVVQDWDEEDPPQSLEDA